MWYVNMIFIVVIHRSSFKTFEYLMDSTRRQWLTRCPPQILFRSHGYRCAANWSGADKICGCKLTNFNVQTSIVLTRLVSWQNFANKITCRILQTMRAILPTGRALSSMINRWSGDTGFNCMSFRAFRGRQIVGVLSLTVTACRLIYLHQDGRR